MSKVFQILIGSLFIIFVFMVISSVAALVIGGALYLVWNYALVYAFAPSIKALTFFQCFAIGLVIALFFPKGGR
jgi:hypothetical protein